MRTEQGLPPMKTISHRGPANVSWWRSLEGAAQYRGSLFCRVWHRRPITAADVVTTSCFDRSEILGFTNLGRNQGAALRRSALAKPGSWQRQDSSCANIPRRLTTNCGKTMSLHPIPGPPCGVPRAERIECDHRRGIRWDNLPCDNSSRVQASRSDIDARCFGRIAGPETGTHIERPTEVPLHLPSVRR